MLVLLALLGVATAASTLALFRYLRNVLRQLPASNADFSIDLSDGRALIACATRRRHPMATLKGESHA